MCRSVLTTLALAAVALTLGCRHIAGVNDCGGDPPLCLYCNCGGAGGCHGGVEPVVTTGTLMTTMPKGSGSGSVTSTPAELP